MTKGEEEIKLGLVASDESEYEEDTIPPPKFSVCQVVLARDKDGLLYDAVIRRSLWGLKQQSQELVGMADAQEETEQETSPTWHYFVHYSKWKVNWDRWASEGDIMEITPENEDLAKRILEEHKALQKKFKDKKRKITDGGAFLKAWKMRLNNLMAGNNPQKKEDVTRKRSKQSWEKDFKLRTKQSLTLRKGTSAQQIVLSFGLKKVLVEDWEIVHQFYMVHQLPARVTVRQALDMYLESKGLKRLELVNDADTVNGENESERKNNESRQDGQNKEWEEMADGIALLFEQALPFRLLYPSERSQLYVLENSEKYGNKAKAELYGCEFLLRLFSQLPSILTDAYDGEEDITRPMMAKINDAIRFFQKNQSTLFAQSYRKKNEDEISLEQKIAKRQERKRKLIETNKAA